MDVNGATEPAIELSGAELRRSLAILRRAIEQRAEREQNRPRLVQHDDEQ